MNDIVSGHPAKFSADLRPHPVTNILNSHCVVKTSGRYVGLKHDSRNRNDVMRKA